MLRTNGLNSPTSAFSEIRAHIKKRQLIALPLSYAVLSPANYYKLSMFSLNFFLFRWICRPLELAQATFRESLKVSLKNVSLSTWKEMDTRGSALLIAFSVSFLFWRCSAALLCVHACALPVALDFTLNNFQEPN
jgi:hypothetical protein